MVLEGKQRAVLFGGVIVLILLLLNSLIFFFRVDLTAGQAYTISDTSRKILGSLKAPVQLTYYVSDKLKSRSPNFQQITDFLYEYARVGGGNVQIKVENPEGREQELGLDQKGLSPQTLDQSDNTQINQALVYSGIVISYLSETRPLAWVDDPGSVEYQLDATIQQLDRKKNLVLGFMAAADSGAMQPGQQPQPNATFNIARQQLGQLYELRNLNPTDPIDPSIDVLFVFKPESFSKETLKNIDQFIMSGKGVLIAADPVNVILGPTIYGMPSQDSPVDAMLGAYGLTVEKSLIADKYNNRFPVQQGNSRVQQLVAYPLWPKIGPSGASTTSPITTNFQGLDLFWASPVTVANGIKAEVLLSSSPDSTTMPGQGDLGAMQALASYQISQDPRKALSVAVLRTGRLQTAFAADKPALSATENARLIVVGDAEFASDLIQFTRAVQNLYFLKNAFEFLGNDEELMKLRNRHLDPPQLNKIRNPDERAAASAFAWILNVIIVPVGIIVFGVVRAIRRRQTAPKGEV